MSPARRPTPPTHAPARLAAWARAPHAAVCVWAFSAVLLGACPDGERRPVTERPSERADDPALDEALLSALAQAKNLHHQADVYLADGNPEKAIDAVARILHIPFPDGAPEGEDTRLDARARLAKLHLGLGRLDEARRIVEEGLAAASRESFFSANLYTVSGEIHEARAKALEATDPAAAREARRQAIEAFERSIEINRRVQERIRREMTP